MTIRTLALPAALVALFSVNLVGCSGGDDTGDSQGDDEICNDNVDNDLDGDEDCDDSDCADDPACVPPENDCADGDEACCSDGVDNDEDGDIDCDDSDCDKTDICNPFEPTVYGGAFNVGILGGEFGTASYNGSALDNSAVLYLIDTDHWSGLDDEEYTCSVYYSLDTAEAVAIEDTDFASDPFAFGWQLSGADVYGTFGNCENLSEDVFGTSSVLDFLDRDSWNVVFSSVVSSEMRTTLKGAFSDYDTIANSLVGSYLGTDYGADAVEYQEVDYGLVYSIDETGEIQTDGTNYIFVDMTGATYAPDGFYSASAYWLPYL